MAIKIRNILKGFFKTGEKPTEQQFADVLDSYVHLKEDAFALLPGGGSAGMLPVKASNGSTNWALPEDAFPVAAQAALDANNAQATATSAKALAEYCSGQIAILVAYYEQLKASTFVSIVEFGAVPAPAAHGGTQEVPLDCTEAFQAALGNEKKRVFVPAGRWLITAPLLIPDGVELFGEITPDGGESEIFCNESWGGGDMLTLGADTTLRRLFINGAGCCEYNINGGSSKNVLIKDCSAADSTLEEIFFYGHGMIEGGSYDRPPSSDYGKRGATFALGGIAVEVKDLNVAILNISGGDGGSHIVHNVNTRTLIANYNARLMFWGGSVTEEVFLNSDHFEYGKFFGTKLAPAAAITLKNIPEVVELIGCI